MTYEEAKERVKKAAGDYQSIAVEHNFNSAMLKKRESELEQALRTVVAELSLPPIDVQLLPDNDQICVTTKGHFASACLLLQDMINSPDADKFIRCRFDRAFTEFVGDISSYNPTATLKEVQQTCGYLSLMMSNITKEVTDIIYKNGKSLDETRRAKIDLEEDYKEYCSQLESEMEIAASCWLSQVNIVPGTRLCIQDLRTINTSRKTEIRTVKSISNTADMIAFKETASVVTDKSRIHPLKSWLINEPEFAEIEKTLNLLKVLSH